MDLHSDYMLIALLAGLLVTKAALALVIWKWRRANVREHEATRIIENLSEGVYRSSLDGKQLSANPSLVKLNGYASEGEMLRSVNSIEKEWYVDPNRREEFRRVLERDGRVVDFVSEIYRHKTRERIWISENAQLVRHSATGAPLYYEGTVREVTDAMTRRRAEERLNKLAANLPGGLFQLRRQKGGVFTAPYISEAFYRIARLEPSADYGDIRRFLHVIEPEDLQHYLETLRESGTTLTEWRCEVRLSREISPEGRWIRIQATPEMLDDATVQWNGFMCDVTSERELAKHVEFLAYFDPLTELPNRRLMQDRLEQARAVTRRRNKRGGAMFIDLDDFKNINDTYGHDVGDAYIKKVGACIKRAVRESDTVSRFGGDEFVVLLHDLDEDESVAETNAETVAKKVLKALDDGFQLQGSKVSASASIGFTTFMGKTLTSDEVLRRADVAMYDAKRAGRGQLRAFSGEKPELNGKKSAA